MKSWNTKSETIQSAGRSTNVELAGVSLGSIPVAGKHLSIVEITKELNNADVKRTINVLADTPTNPGDNVSVIGSLSVQKVAMPFAGLNDDGEVEPIIVNGRALTKADFTLNAVEGQLSIFGGTLEHHVNRIACSLKIEGPLTALANSRNILFNASVGNNVKVVGMLKYLTGFSQMAFQPGADVYIIGHVESVALDPIYPDEAATLDDGTRPCLYPLIYRIVVDSVPNTRRGQRSNFGAPTLMPSSVPLGANSALPAQILDGFRSSQV